jgi:hypothetical protein
LTDDFFDFHLTLLPSLNLPPHLFLLSLCDCSCPLPSSISLSNPLFYCAELLLPLRHHCCFRCDGKSALHWRSPGYRPRIHPHPPALTCTPSTPHPRAPTIRYVWVYACLPTFRFPFPSTFLLSLSPPPLLLFLPSLTPFFLSVPSSLD